ACLRAVVFIAGIQGREVSFGERLAAARILLYGADDRVQVLIGALWIDRAKECADLVGRIDAGGDECLERLNVSVELADGHWRPPSADAAIDAGGSHFSSLARSTIVRAQRMTSSARRSRASDPGASCRTSAMTRSASVNHSVMVLGTGWSLSQISSADPKRSC